MHILQKLFSIRNDNNHKLITILGFKIKFLNIKKLKKENDALVALLHKNNKIIEILNNSDPEFKHYVVDNNLVPNLSKLIPRTPQELHVEVNIVDHCNLNCKFCDHFSPIAKEFYLDLESFEKDMKQLGFLTNGYIGELSLLGGEPLLHKDICRFFEISRKYFPYGNIDITSNGILLQNLPDYIWDSMKKYDIKLFVTTYPLKIDYEKIDKIAKKKKIKYERFYMFGTDDKEKVSIHHPLDLTGSVCKHEYINCYFMNKCSHLKNGKMSTCSIVQTSKIFNEYFNQNLQPGENDCIDIHKLKSYNELAEFLVKRPDFCNYCKVNQRFGTEYGLSKKDIKEWT